MHTFYATKHAKQLILSDIFSLSRSHNDGVDIKVLWTHDEDQRHWENQLCWIKWEDLERQ